MAWRSAQAAFPARVLDELVAAFGYHIDGVHELFEMLFQNADVVGTQHHKREFSPLQILLIFEALVCCDHDSEPLIFRYSQKLAVDKARPTQFRRRPDLVLCEIGPELVGDVLVK
jgi:hypothetical protein